jgi:hypothetical protein
LYMYIWRTRTESMGCTRYFFVRCREAFKFVFCYVDEWRVLSFDSQVTALIHEESLIWDEVIDVTFNILPNPLADLSTHSMSDGLNWSPTSPPNLPYPRRIPRDSEWSWTV